MKKKQIILWMVALLAIIWPNQNKAQGIDFSNIIEVVEDENPYYFIQQAPVKALGNANWEIVWQAKSIQAILLASNNHDHVGMPMVVYTEFSAIPGLLLCDPAMYASNKKVYTNFESWIDIVFVGAGNKTLTVSLDFASKKWLALDNDNNEICRYDLPNWQWLQFSLMMFYDEDVLIKKWGEVNK
ncbi:MAG: hypothetical protein LIP03_10240 [Bacteroidales bacterium]|nr:hypothetical protein [Bacteroidales bacterium]